MTKTAWRVVEISLLLALAGSAAAADAPPAPPPPSCAGPEYRQFDFWAGHWSVDSADGKTHLGDSHVDVILEGCALHEHWQGAKNFRGESFNHYDAQKKQWHQFWIDQSGVSLDLTGHLEGRAMILQGQQVQGNKRTLERISWTLQNDGRVQQLWETSADEGITWSVTFDGWYKKAP